MSTRNYEKGHTESRAMAVLLIALTVGISGLLYIDAATYTDETVATGCECRTATVRRLISGDNPQNQTWQDWWWTQWKGGRSGIVDSDRLDNATYTYNCHAYVYYSSNRWLNWSQATKWHGNSTGCWKKDSSGTIYSYGPTNDHSCKVSEYTGKCGSNFLAKHNNYVPSYTLPSTKYKKVE